MVPVHVQMLSFPPKIPRGAHTFYRMRRNNLLLRAPSAHFASQTKSSFSCLTRIAVKEAASNHYISSSAPHKNTSLFLPNPGPLRGGGTLLPEAYKNEYVINLHYLSFLICSLQWLVLQQQFSIFLYESSLETSWKGHVEMMEKSIS